MKPMQNPRIEELVRRDPRYPPEAYEFVFEALAYANKRLGRVRAETGAAENASREEHVSVAEFFEGLRELALRDFGLMAPAVFRQWGVRRTDDFGEIVFNLVEANLMSKTSHDDRRDFHNVYDLDEALERGYRIEAPQEAEDA
jgi:uncharacterized repeat protein (TIGR04138 family)